MAQIKAENAKPLDAEVSKLIYIDPVTGEPKESSVEQKVQAKAFQTENFELNDELLGEIVNSDYQKDVLETQTDSSLDPGATPTEGDRYIIENVSSLHANFGTITQDKNGEEVTLSNGDIVQYVNGAFVVAYDVSARGEGAFVWDRSISNFKKWDGSAWTLASAEATLGLPPDGDYDDGLFSFSSSTTAAAAVDDINEALKYLAPAQGYTMENLDGSSLSFSGGPSLFSSNIKIVGDSDNVLITTVAYDGTDTNGGSRSDFIQDVNFSLTTPNTADKDGTVNVGFRQADQGVLSLEVNGVEVDSLDLGSLFVEGDRAVGQTITAGHTATNGKLQVTSIQPTNNFPLWQDGTAKINISSGDLYQGWNRIQLKHTVNAQLKASYVREYWYAPVMTTPVASSAAINAAGANSNEPNTDATTRQISGVEYYNAGTFNAVSASVNNPYGATYWSNGLVLTSSHLSTANVATPLPVIGGPGMVTNTPWVATGNSMAIQSNRRVLLGESLTVTATPKNNYGSNGTPDTDSITNLLIDSYSAESTNALTHEFRSEVNRVTSNANFDSILVDANWDSTESLVDGGTAGYSDGLICYNDALRYPTQDFSSITAPSAGPNYSACSGRRSYIGIWKDTSTNRNNFRLTLNGISASNLGATTDATKIHVEMALPTQTTDGTNFEWKDCMRAYTTDSAIGCQNGAAPSGSNPVILFTSGTKGTANSGGKVLVRISYPEGSSAAITSLVFSFTQS